MKRLAWGWSGDRIGDVPEVVIADDDGILYLLAGDDSSYHLNEAALPDIVAALKNYDPANDPYGRGAEDSQVLGLHLKEWRKKRGWSAKQAAENLGIPLRTLQGIEQSRGFGFPTLLFLAIEALDSRLD